MTTRPADSHEYDCAICLSTPEGHVHQCRNGHLFCAECLSEHRARASGTTCPTCRVPLPSEPIRNIVAENAIARQPSTCPFCALQTTVGDLKTHLHACPKRKVSCVAADHGCLWVGKVVGERAAHEKTCQYAICRKILEPVKSELADLRRENASLRSKLDAPLALIYPQSGLRAAGNGLWRVHDEDGVFATAGLPGTRLTSGKWYYEVTIVEEPEFPQFGFARQGFTATTDKGCGDDAFSYAADGMRCKVWHQGEHEAYGEEWEVGDVVGLLLDLDARTIAFSVNGGYEEDEPFTDISGASGWFPALTMRAGLVKVNFGQRDLEHLPTGFWPISDADVAPFDMAGANY